eukprot:2828313-Alexandrium_andersonii.AAC.1
MLFSARKCCFVLRQCTAAPLCLKSASKALCVNRQRIPHGEAPSIAAHLHAELHTAQSACLLSQPA